MLITMFPFSVSSVSFNMVFLYFPRREGESRDSNSSRCCVGYSSAQASDGFQVKEGLCRSKRWCSLTIGLSGLANMECTVRWGSKSLLAKPRSRQNLPNKKANFRVRVMTGFSIRNTIYGAITRGKPRKSSAKESEWMSAAVRCLSLLGTLKLPYAVHSLRTHVWGVDDVLWVFS